MSRHKRDHKGPTGSLTAAMSPNDVADRTATVIEPAVDELPVACECGKSTRKFPAADVRAGRCQWWCDRRRCKPPTEET